MLEHLRGLAVFACVAEQGSFRGAARALSLAPSVVSHHLRELEARLGLPLLYRTTRKLSLTPDGERLLVEARAMVSAAERGLDAMSGKSTSPSGTLRLTAPAFLAGTRLSRDLAAFCEAHPRVRLEVSFSDAPRELVRDGFDLALRAGRLEGGTHRAKRLAELRRVLVASPRYLATKPAPKAPRDLAGWDFVQLRSRPPEVLLVARAGERTARVSFEPRLVVDSAAAMRELALAGVGLVALPEVLAREELERERLREVLPRWRPASVHVYAVWPESAQRAELTARLVDFLAPRVAALLEPAAPV